MVLLKFGVQFHKPCFSNLPVAKKMLSFAVCENGRTTTHIFFQVKVLNRIVSALFVTTFKAEIPLIKISCNAFKYSYFFFSTIFYRASRVIVLQLLLIAILLKVADVAASLTLVHTPNVNCMILPLLAIAIL